VLDPWRNRILLVLFFLSGTAGLLYEVIWVRALGLVVGSEAVASQAVLSAYFAGTALGAWLLGRRGDKTPLPLRLYARLEIGIGIAGLWSLLALSVVERVAPHLTDGCAGPKLGAVAYASAAAAFLPSTLLMGATLPVLVRAVCSDALQAPRALATLYAVNTLGAVVGALLAAFALVPVVGIHAVVGIAVATNLLAALGAFAIGRSAARSFAGLAASPAMEPVAGGPRGTESPRLLVAALACAGFAGVSFELAAIRALALSFDNTIYSFAVTVSAFLVGIVLGSAVVRRAPHLATGRVPASTILAGATLALAIAGYLLSTATGLRQVLLAVFGSTWTGTVLAEMTTAVLLVLPAAASTSLVFCALAPRVVRALSSESHDLSIALLANLVGSALAPLVSGLVAMPLDGARGAVRGAVIALGLAAAWLGGGRGTSAMLLLISFGCAIALPPQLHRWAMGSNQEVVEAREGADGAVAVERHGSSLFLRTGSHYFDGGDTSIFAEKREGHLPMLLHPAPHRVLVLGVGTGTTLGAVARHPGVEVDGVDLFAEVMDVLPRFSRANDDVQKNPSVRLHHADARSFVRSLAARAEKYDVVIADLYHANELGAGSLYTREHFQAIREVLAPGGLFLQWLPLYEIPPEDLAIVIRTFLDVFPEATGWFAYFNARQGVLGLCGSDRALGLDWDSLVARAEAQPLRTVLDDTLLYRPMELFGSYVTDRSGLERLAGSAALNTDDRPLIEYGIPRRTMGDAVSRMRSLDAVMAVRAMPGETTLRFSTKADIARDRKTTLATHQRAIGEFIQGQRALAVGSIGDAVSAFERGYEAVPALRENYIMLVDVARHYLQEGDRHEAERVLRWLANKEPDNREVARLVAEAARVDAAAP